MIFAIKSIGYHTNHHAYNVYLSALMLKKEGVCFIDIPNENLLLNKNSTYSKKEINFKKKQINNLDKIFKRFINLYNKKYNTNFEFSLEKVNSTIYFNYYKIKRKK